MISNLKPELISPSKKNILIFSDWFDPAYKAGGPVTSLVNFCNRLADEYNLSVFTSDKDLGGTSVVEENKQDVWIQWAQNDQVKVYYSSKRPDSALVRAVLSEKKPQFVYLNSMFSFSYTLMPLWGLRNKRTTIILNPRGMLLTSALSQKRLKKKLFLALIKRLNIWEQIRWQHASLDEENDTKKVFGKNVQSVIVRNFSVRPNTESKKITKVVGELKLVFVGRAHPIKNLHFLLSLMKKLKAQVTLSVYGKVEDVAYHQKCQSLAAELPANVRVNFCGDVHPNALSDIYQEHHFLVLPSLGENFGHVIPESWSNARPVCISDQTPWQNLEERNLGFVASLESESDFFLKLRSLVELDNASFQNLCAASIDYSKKLFNETEVIMNYRNLFS